jgi:hypothetical protein
MGFLLSVAIASLASLADPPAASGKSVAQLPTEYVGELEPHWRESISRDIEQGFARGDFSVVSAAQLVELVPAAVHCKDPMCRAKALHGVHADFIVRSVVAVEERDFKMKLEVIDPTGAVVATAEDTCDLCGAEEAGELAGDLAATLRRKIEALVRAPVAISR